MSTVAGPKTSNDRVINLLLKNNVIELGNNIRHFIAGNAHIKDYFNMDTLNKNKGLLEALAYEMIDIPKIDSHKAVIGIGEANMPFAKKVAEVLSELRGVETYAMHTKIYNKSARQIDAVIINEHGHYALLNAKALFVSAVLFENHVYSLMKIPLPIDHINLSQKILRNKYNGGVGTIAASTIIKQEREYFYGTSFKYITEFETDIHSAINCAFCNKTIESIEVDPTYYS